MGLGNLQDSGSSLTHASAFLPRGSAVASVWASSPPLRLPTYSCLSTRAKPLLPVHLKLWLETVSKNRGLGRSTMIGLRGTGYCWTSYSDVRAKSQPELGSPRHGWADDGSRVPGEERQRDKPDRLGVCPHFLCDLGKSLLLSELQFLICGTRGLD